MNEIMSRVKTFLAYTACGVVAAAGLYNAKPCIASEALKPADAQVLSLDKRLNENYSTLQMQQLLAGLKQVVPVLKLRHYETAPAEVIHKPAPKLEDTLAALDAYTIGAVPAEEDTDNNQKINDIAFGSILTCGLLGAYGAFMAATRSLRRKKESKAEQRVCITPNKSLQPQQLTDELTQDMPVLSISHYATAPTEIIPLPANRLENTLAESESINEIVKNNHKLGWNESNILLDYCKRFSSAKELTEHITEAAWDYNINLWKFKGGEQNQEDRINALKLYRALGHKLNRFCYDSLTVRERSVINDIIEMQEQNVLQKGRDSQTVKWALDKIREETGFNISKSTYYRIKTRLRNEQSREGSELLGLVGKSQFIIGSNEKEELRSDYERYFCWMNIKELTQHVKDVAEKYNEIMRVDGKDYKPKVEEVAALRLYRHLCNQSIAYHPAIAFEGENTLIYRTMENNGDASAVEYLRANTGFDVDSTRLPDLIEKDMCLRLVAVRH